MFIACPTTKKEAWRCAYCGSLKIFKKIAIFTDATSIDQRARAGKKDTEES